MDYQIHSIYFTREKDSQISSVHFEAATEKKAKRLVNKVPKWRFEMLLSDWSRAKMERSDWLKIEESLISQPWRVQQLQERTEDKGTKD